MRLALRLRRCGAVLTALLIAGCATAPVAGMIQHDGPGDDFPNSSAVVRENNSQGAAPAANGSEKAAKPPAPRTLCQAFRAYLRCLCSPKSARESSTDSASAGQANNKEHSRREGEAGDQQPEDRKSPPAAGKSERAKDQPEREDRKSEEPEKRENGQAKNNKDEKEKESEPEWYSAHAQTTIVIQKHGGFHAPYTGPNSLLENEPAATSMTGTLFLDVRLWECGGSSTELVFNPEIAGGRGLSGVFGIAGFPNGEITRVGAPEPTPYIARLFVRQVCGFGGEQENVEDGPNQIAGKRDIDRFTLTVGKFAAEDLIDDNKYSHDPRTQFLPWSIMFNGAWDYPANVRGYTYGIGMELNRKDWALRYGIWGEPEVANGSAIDPHFTKAFGQAIEWEQRYTLYERPGKLRLMAYLNRAHMGDYTEALAAMPVNPDVTLTRDYRYKYGFGLGWEQELTKDLGLFARLGWDDGHTESWAFTAIDRVADLGLLLKGRCWCRPNDQVGLALGINGLARVHRDYLAAGGLDFIIGDGALNYAPEQILEAFYNLEVRKGIYVTTDFQEVIHPAFNADRGPVSVVALRVHLEY